MSHRYSCFPLKPARAVAWEILECADGLIRERQSLWPPVLRSRYVKVWRRWCCQEKTCQFPIEVSNPVAQVRTELPPECLQVRGWIPSGRIEVVSSAGGQSVPETDDQSPTAKMTGQEACPTYCWSFRSE